MKRPTEPGISFIRSEAAEIGGSESLGDSDKNLIAEMVARWILTGMSDRKSIVKTPKRNDWEDTQ